MAIHERPNDIDGAMISTAEKYLSAYNGCVQLRKGRTGYVARPRPRVDLLPFRGSTDLRALRGSEAQQEALCRFFVDPPTDCNFMEVESEKSEAGRICTARASVP